MIYLLVYKRTEIIAIATSKAITRAEMLHVAAAAKTIMICNKGT